MKEFKGIWLPNEVIKNTNINDKEKMIYSMILSLSKNQECIVTNSYISKIFNITTIQVSRVINSLKRKGFIKVNLTYKQNSKEIQKRVIIPINIDVNTYKQISSKPINIDVKDILNNNKIYDNKKWKYKSERDYSNFNWNSLYANWKIICITKSYI